MLASFSFIAVQDLAAVAFPGKQCRRALLAQHQLLVALVPGDRLKSFVLVFGRAQVVGLEISLVQLLGHRVDLDDGQAVLALVDHCHQPVFQDRHAFRIFPAIERHLAEHIALQAQLDEERVFAHDGKQRFGLRVVGDVRGFVLSIPGNTLASMTAW